MGFLRLDFLEHGRIEPQARELEELAFGRFPGSLAAAVADLDPTGLLAAVPMDPVSALVLAQMGRSADERVHQVGIQCRTCRELVAAKTQVDLLMAANF